MTKEIPHFTALRIGMTNLNFKKNKAANRQPLYYSKTVSSICKLLRNAMVFSIS